MSTRLARLVRLVRTWRTWRMLLLVPAVSCAGDEGCQPARDGRCQFPFVMNNMTLHSCTWYRSYGTGGYPWCATQAGLYQPTSSCSNLALCRPDSGQPISSLECRPASSSCASEGVQQVCEETYNGQARHTWCVRISNITGRAMATHYNCPQHCLKHQEDNSSLSLGIICSSSTFECSIYFLLSLLLGVVVIFLSIVVCLLLRRNKSRQRFSIKPGDYVSDSISFS